MQAILVKSRRKMVCAIKKFFGKPAEVKAVIGCTFNRAIRLHDGEVSPDQWEDKALWKASGASAEDWMKAKLDAPLPKKKPKKG